jgi:hypothetical protein
MESTKMRHRKIALSALKNLCTFIGAIALFSYFYNWTIDTRHWYVTLASAFACSLLWLGFYMTETYGGGVTHLSLRLARAASSWLSAHLWTKQLQLPFPDAPAATERNQGPKAEPNEEQRETIPPVAAANELPQPAPTLPWLSRPHPRHPT